MESTIGRTNGLTNGLRGRTNGLTNGLGHTNGLTNGMGRTNGLTNGLVSLRRGLTNGLTNGNGFTNGLGSARFRREARLSRWKLYLVPLIAVGLLLVPLFVAPDLVPAGPIQIDGVFGDWSGAPLVALGPRVGVNPNVNLLEIGVVDADRSLAFYVKVAGQAFAGGGTPPRYDALRVFLDTDRDPSTGYVVAGLGADRLVEAFGHGGRVLTTRASEWDGNRNASDWNGWTKSTPIAAASTGPRVELEVDWSLLVPSKAPVHAYLHLHAHDGSSDEADLVLASEGPSLVVGVEPTPAAVLSGLEQEILRLHVACSLATCGYSSVTVHLEGTAPYTAVSALRLRDVTGGLVAQRIPGSAVVPFGFAPRTLAAGQEETLVVTADVSGGSGETLGAAVGAAVDIDVPDGATYVRRLPSPRSVGYLGAVPAGIRIDGGFAEWTNASADPSEAGRRPDVDLQGYAFMTVGSTAAVYLSVAGRALSGTVVPQENAAVPSAGAASVDSDRDTVPDSDDGFPFDFNNDGLNDVATGGDYDGDSISDYPVGSDWYLNTTIPGTFPAPYANRPVSMYIGPTQRPQLLGEDVARVFFDADNSPATGFRIKTLGADLLVEVRGRNGEVTYRSASAFSGASQLAWSWAPLLAFPVATDYWRIEASFPSGSLGLTNASVAYFEVMDWTRIPDGSVDAAFSMRPSGFVPAQRDRRDVSEGVQTLDIPGNTRWFFTNGATTGAGCSTNRAASTTAGSAATSTTLTASFPSICWFTPASPPSTIAGSWEVILDIDKTTDGTKVLRPNANGDVNDWDVGAGCTDATEWQCVDDNPNDSDTSYIVSTSNLVTLDSLYNIFDWTTAPAPPSPLSILNVVVQGSCRKIAGPVVGVRLMIKSGSTTSVGTTDPNCANSATYTVWSETWTTDPADGLAWTLADINALQIGVRDVDSLTRELRVSHVMATVTWVPVYSVQIDKCTVADCSSYTTLYGPTNSNTYGGDVTFTTPSIAAQTFTATERIRFQVILYVDGSSTPGSVTVRYNGPDPSADDSRGTVPIPEFKEAIIPIAGAIVLYVTRRRVLGSRGRRRSVRARSDVSD